ncbi:MAG: DUF1850 domain-containing protein [Bifidobacteriaceae bacterium]|nr:DUF1850 domain-containing protein [Bifidobacteriaceae bacterium]
MAGRRGRPVWRGRIGRRGRRGRAGRRGVGGSARAVAVWLALAAAVLVGAGAFREAQPTLRIENLDLGEVIVALPVQAGDELFFGWEHSLDRFPWDEFYRVGRSGDLILEMIRFPAFGAGVPEAKGAESWTEDGLIHLAGTGQAFEEIVWLNSAAATKDLKLNGEVIARGRDLPARARLRLSVRPG